MLLWCENTTELNTESCEALDPDYVCAYDPFTGKHTCMPAPDCIPQCGQAGSDDFKECGADGCGGSCGTCPEGWPCEVGACIPKVGGDCGAVTSVGVCIDDDVWFCTENDKLQIIDCALFGQTCGWNAEQASYDCK